MLATASIVEDGVYQYIRVETCLIILYTARYGKSRVIVETHELAPTVMLSEWDYVAEGSLKIFSGHITVHAGDPPGQGTLTIEVDPGRYRIRVHHGNVESVTDPDAIDGDDYYLVKLWRSEEQETVILKQHRPP